MKRGGYGKPWRPPADGWSVPPKIFFGGLYQHIRPALNNLPRFQNNTQVTLQTNEVGSPATRINPQALVANCNVTDTSGLPEVPWIGLADNQYLPPVLGGNLTNTFQQNGTDSFGQTARQRGFKNVQAVRQWHGCFGWLSQDAPSPVANTLCVSEVCDCQNNPPPGSGLTCGGDPTPGSSYYNTYNTTSYTPFQARPDQTKYTQVTWSVSYDESSTDTDGNVSEVNSTGGGAVSVDAYSGKLTSSLATSETDTNTPNVGPPDIIKHVVNGYDSVTNTYGNESFVDGIIGNDFHSGYPPAIASQDLFSFVNWWSNGQCGLTLTVGANPLPPVTDPNNYDASLNFSTPSFDVPTNINHWTIHVKWSRTATEFSWIFSYHNWCTTTDGSTPSLIRSDIEFSGSATLSNPNTAADVYADVKNLLGYWNLADDAQYPPRTDGLWQVAPLVSREEQEGDITPLGFNPCYVNDLRSPTIDANGNSPWTTPVSPPPPGWNYAPNNNDGAGRPPGDPNYSGAVPWNPTYNQMAWFDPAAYGFTFPPGRDQSSSPATGFQQFALTGLILGMPMPTALLDPNSYWYISGYNPPRNGTWENFFDFRAQVWRACTFTGDCGDGVDIYAYGYGEWLYDAIGRTGAQLPHCATQWTNNLDAISKRPYAWLVQAESQPLVFEPPIPPPGYDGECNSIDWHANRADALWAQKCCEIVELWPSQNFFRPAGNDRFAPDENAVYCIDHWVGDTAYFLSDPANIHTGDFVGVSNNGYVGVFPVSVDHAGLNISLGSQLYPLPTGFALPSGDTGTAMWKVRFPSAPPILGRDAIASLTPSGGNTIITLSSPEVNLMTGDTIDICSTTITYDAKGNRVSETMAALQSAVAVNRTDDTHFTVGVAIGLLAGAAYICSHSSSSSSSSSLWYWDDNGRKGDFAALQWLYDYRTNAEASRLSGVTGCNGHTPPDGTPANAWPPGGPFTTPNGGFTVCTPLPATCSANNSLSWTSDGFQAQGSIRFTPCCYGVVAITPNGESWNNGVVIPFPANFNFDDRYGARWQAEIEQAMQDLLWQAPHTPCNLGSHDTWNEDDGTCKCQTPCENSNGGLDIYYAHAPFVEARISLPGNGGNAQNETAPALPAGIALGYVNPATASGGLIPPGVIDFDITTGNPSGTFTIWSYRLAIENNACFGTCQFNYVDAENLPCVVSYSPPAPAAPADGNSGSGNSGDATVT